VVDAVSRNRRHAIELPNRALFEMISDNHLWSKAMVIVSILMMLHMFVGRLVVMILPMFWAYNVAQRGDGFGYAVLTYFGNVILLGLVWAAVWWLLSTIMKGMMVNDG